MAKSIKDIPVHNIKTKEIHSQGFDIIDLKGTGGKEYDSSVPHRHNFFELLLFIDGTGTHEIDFNNYPIEGNSAHFVSPGQIHRLRSKKTKGSVICFSEDFILLNRKENFMDKFPFYDTGSVIPVIKLNQKQISEITSLTKCLMEEFKADRDNTEVLRSYLNIILLKLKEFFFCLRKNKKQNAPDKGQKLLSFKKLINTHFILHKSVSDYSALLGISPNHLNALSKKHEGKTAIQLIQERVMLEARRLLYSTEMSVKEISFELNFEDMAYFNRFFKKHMKVTPGSYRESFTIHR